MAVNGIKFDWKYGYLSSLCNQFRWKIGERVSTPETLTKLLDTRVMGNIKKTLYKCRIRRKRDVNTLGRLTGFATQELVEGWGTEDAGKNASSVEEGEETAGSSARLDPEASTESGP